MSQEPIDADREAYDEYLRLTTAAQPQIDAYAQSRRQQGYTVAVIPPLTFEDFVERLRHAADAQIPTDQTPRFKYWRGATVSQELTDAEWLRDFIAWHASPDAVTKLPAATKARLRSIADRLERPGVEATLYQYPALKRWELDIGELDAKKVRRMLGHVPETDFLNVVMTLTPKHSVTPQCDPSSDTAKA